MINSNSKLSTPKQSNIMGIGFMLLHTLSLSVLYVLVKKLTVDLDSNLVVFLYKFTILILALPWCLHSGIKSLSTTRLKLHISRAIFSTLGSLCMFYAIKHINLGDVTAVTKLEQIFLLIIGILYFKEQITKTKVGVIITSFLGAVLIISPNILNFTKYGMPYISMSNFKGDFNSYYIFIFLAIFFWSINSTVIKVLGKTEKTKVQLFYVMLFSCIISFPVSFMNWEAIYFLGPIEIRYPVEFRSFSGIGLQTSHIKYILLLALCYFGHIIGNFKAFKHAELSIVVPLEYTRLVMAGIFGYVFFSETPLPTALIGYTMIIVSGLYLFYSEHRKARKKKRKEMQEALREEYDQQ